MRFDVRSDGGGRRITSRVSVDDADNARQTRLRQRGDENPAADESRNASDH